MLPTTYRRLALTTLVLSALGVLPASGQVINEDLKITASDGDVRDRFGQSVAIDNSVIAIGAPYDDDNGLNSGSAYLIDASTGAQLFKLIPNDGTEDERFGISIAIHDGIVAVGCFLDDVNGIESGSAYLFDVSNGEQIAKLLPDDGAAGHLFGNSIAIHNGIVAVGAQKDDSNGHWSGSAYLFDASTGEQLFKLLPSEGAVGDLFGSCVAIHDGVVAVGCFLDDDNGLNSGSAYLFDASTGDQIAKLLANDKENNGRFGISIDIDNGVVAIGQQTNVFPASESVYLFNATTGTQLFKLLPSDGAIGDTFGQFIAIDNEVVVVGSPLDDDYVQDAGSAYLFDASTGDQIAKLLASDGTDREQFGISVAIDNGIVVVGKHLDDDNGSTSGSAYVFSTPTPCPADLTGEGDLNFLDVSAFLAAFEAQDPAADFEADGNFNFLDVSAFLAAFGAGCP